MNFINILYEIIALIALILLGFFCFKIKLLKAESSQLLSTLIINISFPMLIVVSMNRKYSNDLLHNSLILMGISVIVYLIIVLLAEIWGRKTKKPHRQASVLKWIAIFGNCSFMGFPVINAIYGSIGVFYAAVFNMFYIFLMFSYGIVILQKGAVKSVAKSLLNPGLIATVIGFALFIFKISLPYVILRPMQMIGDTTIPLALITTGISLAQIPLRELIHPIDIWVVSFIRLIALPAIILLALIPFHFNQYLIVIPTVLLGTPTALTAGIFALNYGCDDQLASKGVVLTNFLAILSMPLVVWAVMLAVKPL
jgi:Predicted permeases